MKAKTTKGKKPDKELVVLGFDDNPYRYDAAVWVGVVEHDLAGLINELQRGTRDKLRIHAQAPVKNMPRVNRFLQRTRSTKGAHIGGDWYRVEHSDILPAVLFMNGDAVFSKEHRLSYFQDAVVPARELVAC